MKYWIRATAFRLAKLDQSLARMWQAQLSVNHQLLVLVVLAMPVASVAWTVTHEELFREPREWCAHCSRTRRTWAARKFFYVFTCEYCFSHYVAAAALVITGFTLLFEDWRGYLIAWLSLVWIANVYMSLFGRLRLDIREERLEIAAAEAKAPGAKTG